MTEITNDALLVTDEPQLRAPHTPTEQLTTLIEEIASATSELSFDEARYKDQGELASGGMARIHEVFDKLILRNAAMKVLQPPAAAARLLEEAQITGQLDHPHIVPVYDVGCDSEGRPSHFVMKLVTGRTLADVFADLGPSALYGSGLEKVLQIFLRVCDAVAFAHSRGVVHRDLKPSNIMVGDYGQVYVMDWGIAMVKPAADVRTAVLTAQPVDQPGAVSGTPAYMAPEQARGRIDRIDTRTDVYGLGGILYELLAGRAPHQVGNRQGALAAARGGRILPPDQVRPEVELAPGLCRIALKALAANPEDRYPSVLALKGDVELFLRGGGWFEVREYTAGTAIVEEGDVASAAFILQSGRCRVSRRVDANVVVLRELGPGEVFGETAIFSASTRTADVHAIDEVRVMVVTRQALEKELSGAPWLGAFVKALSDRFVEVSEELAQLRRGDHGVREP